MEPYTGYTDWEGGQVGDSLLPPEITTSPFRIKWVAPTVTLTAPGPTSDVPAGTTSALRATLLGVDGASVPGAPVTFTINDGSNAFQLTPVNTGTDGVASVSYQWPAAGGYSVTASVTVNDITTSAASTLSFTITPAAVTALLTSKVGEQSVI